MFPSILSTFTDPLPGDRLNSPSHSGIETAQNTALEQIERVIGTNASVIGTIIGDLRNTSSNGGGHVQTANKGGTGQTAFTKGDLLVAQSSSVLSKLAVGTNDQVLIADSNQNAGVKWGAAPVTNVQSFISSGNWSKPSAASPSSRVYVEIWGGGGSGASRTANGNESAGGGGGGAYKNGWFAASVLGATEAVNIGAGGVAVSGNTNGNAGGNTVFGTSSLLIAYGGAGGTSGAGSGGLGGGGGGLLGAGSGVNAGSPGSVWGGQGGNADDGGTGIYSGGGAGAQGSGGASGKNGGNAIYGGAGGGGALGAGGTGGGGVGVGGTSGTGGAGGVAQRGSVAGTGGTPAGGGGGSTGGNSGAGGVGKAIITTFY